MKSLHQGRNSMLNINARTLSKVAAALILIASLGSAYKYGMKTANASNSPSGLTGKYGCMLNRNFNGFINHYNTFSPNDSIPSIATSIIDYDTKTIQAMSSMVKGFASSTNPQLSEDMSSGTFVETAISGYSGAYRLTSSLINSNNISGSLKMIAIPVNSGNTVLITEISSGTTNAPWTGVCQKV